MKSKCFSTRLRILFAMLSALMALSFTSCGREEESVPEEIQYVYVPEFTEIAFPENCNIYSPKFIGDSLYYAAIQFGEGDAPSRRLVYEYSLTERTIVREILLGEGGGGIDEFQVSEDGWVYVTDYSYEEEAPGEYSSTGAQLQAFDSQGNLSFKLDLSQFGIRATMFAPLVDSEKRLYLPDADKVILLTPDGTLWGEVKLKDCDHINAIGMSAEGDVYVSYEASENHEVLLTRIDYETKEADTVYYNFPFGYSYFFFAGTDYNFLINDGTRTALYGYDLETQVSEEILRWMDSDLNGAAIDAFRPMEDGSYLVLFNSGNVGSRELVTLTRQDASTLPEKTELVIGTLWTGGDLEEAVSSFNRRSTTLHINVKEYGRISPDDPLTALNLDIVSADSCPDIIDLNALNVDALAANDVFENLSPYLEESEVINREDYLENILDSYTCDGTLVSIPRSFYLATSTGRTAQVGDRSSWTLSEMLDCLEAHPGLMPYYPSFGSWDGNYKQQFLDFCLQFGQGSFIDQAEGICHFDSDDFKRVLRLADALPDDCGSGREILSLPDSVHGDYLLCEVSCLDNFYDIQIYESVYGEDMTFIGYPTEGGNMSHLFTTLDAYAIAARSGHKEDAWSFLEYFLSQDEATLGRFSTNRKNLLSRATAVEYSTDSNGQYLLSLDGKPRLRYDTISYFGYRYQYHTVTEEEIATMLHLIETSRRSTSMDAVILNIIAEETAPLFHGQSTVDQTAGAIQNRVQLYLNENQ